ncbi:MAG: hypothetical protein ACLFQK_07505 [Fibrobacterota bacterium]
MNNISSKILLVVCILSYCGCIDLYFPPTSPPDNSKISGSSSPEDLLAGLMTAYNTRNFELFENLIADDFIFTINPQANPNNPGEYSPGEKDSLIDGIKKYYWTKEEEHLYHKNMFSPFSSPRAEKITLSFSIPPRNEWLPFNSGLPHEPPEGYKISITGIDLSIYISGPSGNTEVSVEDGISVFRVRPYGPEDTWKIAVWQDENPDF